MDLQVANVDKYMKQRTNEKSTILIVDDEIVSRHTVEILLESEGYDIYFAETGEEALVKAKQLMPDVMLLDVMMPGMNGFQVCQKLRADPHLAELPIVIVTALDDRASRLRGLELGADDFMTKPFDRAELRARIRTITRLNRYRRLIETEEKLAYLANYDPLTQLPNRHLLQERIRQLVGHATRMQQNVAVFSIDLDGFQMINDSLGHELGDELLCKIAVRLNDTVSEGVTVAHLGSDEFAILFELANPLNDASNVAQALLDSISHPMQLDNHDIVITASIGISIYPNDAQDASLLLKNAVTAMSRAKTEGKNRYQFFTTEMNQVALQRFTLENQLRKVLEQNELRIYYQPQVDLQTGQIIGVEALLRWQHPEKGIVSPIHFISIAEETGMIIPIGEWVLRTACQQVKTWFDSGLPQIRLSVNVSSRQFQSPNLIENIEETLQKVDFPSCCLELELTESVLMEKHDQEQRSCSSLEILQTMSDRLKHLMI